MTKKEFRIQRALNTLPVVCVHRLSSHYLEIPKHHLFKIPEQVWSRFTFAKDLLSELERDNILLDWLETILYPHR